MTGEPVGGLCPSCYEPKTSDWEWPETVPRPVSVPDGPICGDCFAALVNYTEIGQVPSNPTDHLTGLNMLVAHRYKL